MANIRTFIATFLLLVGVFAIPETQAQQGTDRIAELISLLKTGNENTQLQAVRKLAALGEQSHTAIPALIDALKAEPLERTPLSLEIASTLEKAGIGLPELLAKSVDNQDEILASHVCIELMHQSAPQIEKATELVKLRLTHPDPGIRRSAVDAVTLLRSPDTESARLLIDLARDKDMRVSYRAIGALGQLKPAIPEVVKALTLLTKSSSAPIRYRAIVSLGQIGKNAKSSLPNLISISKSGSGPIAKKAVEAIALIEERGELEMTYDPKARGALEQSPAFKAQSQLEPPVQAVNLSPAPVEQTTAKDNSPSKVESESVRVERLKKLNFSEGSSAIKTLEDGLNDSSPLVKKEAITKISEAGDSPPPQLVSGLERSFNQGEPEIKEAAARALVKIGTAGMNVMISAASSNDAAIRLKAVKSLRNFDRPLSTEAIIALKKNLKDSDERIRTQAAITLANSNSVPGETIPLLIHSLEGNDLSAAVSSTVALSKFSEDAVKPLTAALDSNNPLVRSRAVTALGLMEPPPENILEIIKPLLQDESADVRTSVEQALKSVEAANKESEEEELR